jgi:hypothetical protein
MVRPERILRPYPISRGCSRSHPDLGPDTTSPLACRSFTEAEVVFHLKEARLSSWGLAVLGKLIPCILRVVVDSRKKT